MSTPSRVAAEDLAGVEALDVAAEQIVPGVTDEPAWPTLRAHLLLLAAHGTDPVAQLAAAAGRRELNFAEDRAPSSTGGSTGRIVENEGGVYELGNGEPSALSKVSMLVFKGSREVWGEIRGVAAQMRDRRYWPVTPYFQKTNGGTAGST